MIKQVLAYILVALYIIITGSIAGGTHTVQNQIHHYQQKQEAKQ